jgi:hypothetical protein
VVAEAQTQTERATLQPQRSRSREPDDGALARACPQQQQQPRSGERWRVATIAHDADARWQIRRPTFESRQLAEEWAHLLLWWGPERPRNAALVPVVEGTLQVPAWMRGGVHHSEGSVEEEDEDA